MQDPFFKNTLVLVWHHDEDGAVGIVVNKILEHKLSDVVSFDDEGLEGNLAAYGDNVVGWGGPVEGSTGTVVTTGPVDEEEGWNLPGGLSVTRSQDALKRLIQSGAQLQLVLGYAGWAPEQLEQEIQQGGWLWTDPDPELLFGTPPDQRYARALKSLGLTANRVWMQPIDE